MEEEFGDSDLGSGYPAGLYVCVCVNGSCLVLLGASS